MSAATLGPWSTPRPSTSPSTRSHVTGSARAFTCAAATGGSPSCADRRRSGATRTKIVATRLAPAEPRNDGKQTPYRGHPVFVAQHATATCCRSCLERGHRIAKGHVLTPDEWGYVVDVICRWIERELAAPAH